MTENSQSMMETFMRSYPHITETIFNALDDKSLKNCLDVNQTWKKLLRSQMFFWKRFTMTHSGWKKLRQEMKVEAISALGDSLFALEIDPETRFSQNIHPVFCAIHLNDLEVFETMIKLFPDFSKLTIHAKYCSLHYDVSPFHFAAKEGRIEIVKYFIDQGYSNECPQSRYLNRTPLHLASEYGQFEVVKLLLENIEGDANPKDAEGCTPFHLASKYGHLDIVRLFLDNGENFPKDENRETPLHLATKYGHIRVVQLLLERIEGNKNPKDVRGRTPLHDASEYGHFKIFKLLFHNIVKEKNPKDYYGFTPLHLASKFGHLAIVEFLLERLEDRSPRTLDGKKPLDLACNDEMINLIRSYL